VPTLLSDLEQTLPSSWYRDAAIFDLEEKQIFSREWYCAARVEEVPEPGDHLVIDICGVSILIVRNLAGQLNAFHNVCRHRGSQLCITDPEAASIIRHGGVSRSGAIVCPYHAWTYDLDGKLKRAPHLPDLDTGQVSLYSASLQTWGGFVFVCLSEDPGDFHDFISPVHDALVRYPLDELRYAKRIDYEVAANWKVLCENFNECYHCGPVHPELCRIVPAFKKGGGSDLNWDDGIPHREGATTFTFSGESPRRSFPGLSAAEQANHRGELLYPNLFLSLSRDYVVCVILRPLAHDRTIMSNYFLFEPFEVEKDDFDASDAIDFWDLVNKQDYAICEAVQRGSASGVHEHGVFADMEDWNLDIRRYVRDRIEPSVKQLQQTD